MLDFINHPPVRYLIIPFVIIYGLTGRWLIRIWRPDIRAAKRTYASAETFDEWQNAGRTLDHEVKANHNWKIDPVSNVYTDGRIKTRVAEMRNALQDEEFFDARRLLELSTIRNYCNICHPRLYFCLYAGTKALIEEYIATLGQLVNAVFQSSWKGYAMSKQESMDLSDRALSSYGNTALLLQSGSIFGLCHIGVIKALHERGLLPNVIVGTGAGALIAALVGVQTAAGLSALLDGSAFDHISDKEDAVKPPLHLFILRCSTRLLSFGLRRDTLRRCVEDLVGDDTFEEAFDRTGRKVSIVISGDSPGRPNLLNYITTPNVLIRTAAIASLVSDLDRAPAMIREKDLEGSVQLWSLNDETPAFRDRRRAQKRRPTADVDKNIPLRRICSMENINHFIISQTRPYLLPFLMPSQQRPHSPGQRTWLDLPFLKQLSAYIVHFWLRLYDSLFGLPEGIRRFLIDEKITRPSITLVPELSWVDYWRSVLCNPTKHEIKHWVSVGEKSVWPYVPALRVRCEVERLLDRHYQDARKSHNRYSSSSRQDNSAMLPSVSRRKTRTRSFGATGL